jgi:BatD DUF11 like domain
MELFLRAGHLKVVGFLVAFLGILGKEPLIAQPKFSTICSDTRIGKNELLQVQFKLENASNVERILPPVFKNFNVLSGPNQQSGMTSINGKVNQYVAISFTLQPRSTGKFIIEGATAVADGKELKSKPVSIEVTNQSTASGNSNSPNTFSPFGGMGFDFPDATPRQQFDDYILKPGEKAEEKVQKNLFIKLDVNKTSCYVGEPIVASYKLYTRLRSESTITDAPSFNGFSVSDLMVNNNGDVEKYNGRQYNVYTLRKVQLYPLQAGEVTLDPLVADNKVTFIKSEYANSQNGDRFYDLLENFADATAPASAVIEEHVQLKSKPVTINVLPLPVQHKPDDFRGSVGVFTMQSSLEKNTISTDDAGNLRVTISGKGNLQLINAPKVIWPEGIDGYDATLKDNVDKSSVPMRGSKTFTFPFTVSKAGDYRIDSISFSYFDPQSMSYKTLHTDVLQLHVNKGNGAKKMLAKNAVNNNENSEVFFTKQRLLFASLLMLLIIFIIAYYVKNKKQKQQNKTEATGQKTAVVPAAYVIPENPLLPAHEKLVNGDSKEFYHVLDSSLKKYLAFKFKLPVEELSKKRIHEELDKCNVSLGTCLLLNSLTEEIELNLYAPPSDVCHLKAVFEKAAEVVSLLDKQVCQ